LGGASLGNIVRFAETPSKQIYKLNFGKGESDE
jgi:hypothetical protein